MIKGGICSPSESYDLNTISTLVAQAIRAPRPVSTKSSHSVITSCPYWALNWEPHAVVGVTEATPHKYEVSHNDSAEDIYLMRLSNNGGEPT